MASTYKIITFRRTPAPVQTVESWSTRYGTSNRVVKRRYDGTFVNNISARQMLGR